MLAAHPMAVLWSPASGIASAGGLLLGVHLARYGTAAGVLKIGDTLKIGKTTVFLYPMHHLASAM
ncbi:hypothetical protein C2I19_06980 [Chromobacterium alticapitis]|uniref:Uncharacterized protein n=1 Tax=Chromobacterium alticapitis TaxID=2073169 RepID=A0A2S5DID2_9NEIS|nr:hypothetical protein C2I19_06980 [Chromobacterium alticapitis]